MTTYRFVERERTIFPVTVLCRTLGVSPSGFWAWVKRPPSARSLADALLTERIRAIHAHSRGTYGAPRIHAELRDTDTRCGRKRVARLMRHAGIEGVHRRRFVRTTVRDRGAAPAPDLVNRHFRAACPNQLWVADITYVPTGQGPLYVAVVVDAFSRAVAGWAMAGHLRTELIVSALDMAIVRRHPKRGLVHHSDQGTQYTSLAFGRRARAAGISLSMGSVGDCYDNAMMESFWGTFKTELVHHRHYATREQARQSIFRYIECWYNRRRRHSAIGYMSPEQFEASLN